jgi:hypothetical protein
MTTLMQPTRGLFKPLLRVSSALTLLIGILGFEPDALGQG